MRSVGRMPVDKSKPQKENTDLNESKAAVNMSLDLGNNYLKEIREKNKNLHTNKAEAWKKDLESKDIPTSERYERVLEKAALLEEEAKRREKLLRVQQVKDPVEMQNGINDQYINSIKAKIAVLQDL